MSRTRSYERALEEMNMPQVPYVVKGGYGNPLITGAAALVGQLFGMKATADAQKQQLEMQGELAQQQSLTQAAIEKERARRSQIHAKNMPLYLIGGIGLLTVTGLLLKR